VQEILVGGKVMKIVLLIIIILLITTILFLLMLQFLAMIGVFEITLEDPQKEEMDNSEYDYGHNVHHYNNDEDNFLN
jgi:hypothetical protein